MTPATIIQQIQTQLKSSSDLSYVSDNQIYIGAREGMTIFPCIVIEPVSIQETADAYPKLRVNMQVAIMGFVKVYDKEKQLVGDANVKGAIDLENDIKKALCSDPTLSGKVIELEVQETIYEIVDYPERSVTINANVLFEQNAKTRA